MSHRYLPECLDHSLKDIMNKDLLFAGKLLILGGNFRQILPVVRRAAINFGEVLSEKNTFMATFQDIPFSN